MTTAPAKITARLQPGEFVLAVAKTSRIMLDASKTMGKIGYAFRGQPIPRHIRRAQGRTRARADASIRRARRGVTVERSRPQLIHNGGKP